MKTLALLLYVSLTSFAGTQAPPKFLEVLPSKMVTVALGKTGTGTVSVKIAPEFHIQANPASQPNLIATTLTIMGKDGLEQGTITYPTGVSYRLENSDKDLSTYSGTTDIKIAVNAKTAKLGKYELTGILKFQPCNDKICFFPTKVEVKIPVHVVKK